MRTLAYCRLSLLCGLLVGCGGGDTPIPDNPDGQEIPDDPNSPDAAPAEPDSDNDGLSDADEIEAGTDPNNPDSDGDGLSDGDEIIRGADPLNPDSDGDGIFDGDEVVLGTDPATSDEACTGASARASQTKKPVDIILAIDTSSSMSGEIDAVEQNLNVNLAQQLEASGVDYQIILLADHGQPDVSGKFGICIGPPLSGHTCSPAPAKPVNTPKFKHYPIYVNSHDSFARILSDFAPDDAVSVAPQGGVIPLDDSGNQYGYGQWLRPGSLKVILIVTDDEASGAPDTATAFDDALLALSPEHFGNASNRNYVVHTVIGVEAKGATSEPWLPSDPVKTNTCGSGSEGPAPEYQRASILTEGLRFPLCNNDNFDAVFKEMAVNVTEGVSLPCNYAPSQPITGTLDYNRVVAYFTQSSGDVRTLNRVDSNQACAEDGYYVDNSTVVLCPSTCAEVQDDEAGRLDLHVACASAGID